jgi:hypothetical protein
MSKKGSISTLGSPLLTFLGNRVYNEICSLVMLAGKKSGIEGSLGARKSAPNAAVTFTAA